MFFSTIKIGWNYKYGLISLISLILTLFSCSGNKEHEDERTKDWRLRGNVKSCLICTEHVEKDRDERIIADDCLVTFSRNGRCKKTIFYDFENKTPTGYEILVRENGKIVEEIRYRQNSRIIYRQKLRHISDSITEYEIINENGGKTSYGRIIEQGLYTKSIQTFINENIGGERTHTNLIEHDENGNVISMQQTYDNNDWRVLYRWIDYVEFDKEGNWTKRITYVGEGRDEPQFIDTRVIKYYLW